MQPYEQLARQVHDSAYQDLNAGTQHTPAALQQAVASLPDLVRQGQLGAADVMQIDAALQRPGPPPLEVRVWVSQLNLAAAQAVGDLDCLRQTALTHCVILLVSARALDRRQQKEDLRRITGMALDLAKQWNLQELDPNLIGDLHLEAGNVYMTGFGPVHHEVDRGLQHFLAAYRLKQGGDAAELAKLSTLMRRVAGFVLGQSGLAQNFNVDLARVHQMLETTVEVFEAVGPAPLLLQARFQLLAFYLSQRFLSAAGPLLEALQAEAGEMSPADVTALTLYRADWLSQTDEPTEALDVLQPLFAGNRIADADRIYALTIRANCERLLGRFDEAYNAFHELLQGAEQVIAGKPGDVGAWERVFLAQTHLGYVEIRRDHGAEGRAWFERAARIVESHHISWDSQLRHADLWAQGLYEVEAWEAALDKYEAARALRQRLEAEVGNPLLREGFMGNWALIDARLVELCLRTARPRRALEVVEGSKSRVLQEMALVHAPLGVLGALSPDPRQPRWGGQTAQERLWLHNYALLASERQRLQRELGTQRSGAPESWPIEQRIRSVERQMDGVRDLLEQHAMQRVSRSSAAQASALTADAILSLLPGGGADRRAWGIVSWYSSDQGTSALIATPAEIWGTWQAGWPYERLLREIYEPWEAVYRAYFVEAEQGHVQDTDWKAALEHYRRQWYAALWAPVAAQIKRLRLRHLVILPHRLLHLLPYAALHDEGSGRDLLDQVKTIQVAPGAGFLLAAAERFAAPREAGRPVIFGNPDADAALMGLEAVHIARQWAAARREPIAPYLQPDSHAETLYRASPEASVLHLACHGVWHAEDLSQSGLVLAPLPAGVPPLFGQMDGLLNMPALLTQLSLPRCQLVVLSACESGLARRSAADEPLSLPLAFQMAGARQVIASLWPVADDSTLLLMGEVHRRYIKGQTAAESLAGAQRWLRRLSPTAAIKILRRRQRELAVASTPDAVTEQARHQLEERLEQLAHLPAQARPYAVADDWAAFVCFGGPGH